MIRPGMLVGFIFAFAFSFDELILAIFLTSPATRTVPRLLWEQLNYQMTPRDRGRDLRPLPSPRPSCSPPPG